MIPNGISLAHHGDGYAIRKGAGRIRSRHDATVYYLTISAVRKGDDDLIFVILTESQLFNLALHALKVVIVRHQEIFFIDIEIIGNDNPVTIGDIRIVSGIISKCNKGGLQ